MSDPARIDRIIELLRKYWHRHPNLRLGQIVSNCSKRRCGNPDPYYLDDDALAKMVQDPPTRAH